MLDSITVLQGVKAFLDNHWILLSYSLPTEPSRKRVLVWRHLKKLGAVHLESGVWLLPQTPDLARAIDKAVDEIKDLGGKASAFYAADLPPGQTEALRDAFNEARREEYIDLLQKCQRYLAHVRRVTDAGDFRFVQVEELEEDLEKRRRWLCQVVSRDILGVSERAQVESCLKDCEEALAQFEGQAALEASDGGPKD